MDIKKLQYYVAVCEHMNMTKAAEVLHIAQPSISNSIKQLEDDLGMALFDRSKRQLKLTDRGVVFLEKAKDILNHVEDVMLEMKDLSRSDVGLIKLGVPPMIGTLLFPKILTDFKGKHPYVHLQLSEDGSIETKRKIIDGEVDLGIIILSEGDDDLDTHEILNTEIVACMHRGHPLARHSKLTPQDIEAEKLIMLKEGFYHREVLLKYFRTHHIRPEIAVNTNQLKTLESLVIQGVGISFLFRELVVDNSKMIYRSFGESMSIRIGLAWRKDRYLSSSARLLLEFFGE